MQEQRRSNIKPLCAAIQKKTEEVTTGIERSTKTTKKIRLFGQAHFIQKFNRRKGGEESSHSVIPGSKQQMKDVYKGD